MKSFQIHSNLKSSLVEIISALLIFLFVYTAISKLANHNQFVYTFGVIPFIEKYKNFFAWLIPISELIVSFFLLIPNTKRVGLITSILLLILFSLYIIIMLLFGSNLPCSCGGVIQQLSWKEHLLFNSFFILLAIAGFILSRKQKFLLQ